MLETAPATPREALLEQMLEAVPAGVLHLAEDGTVEAANREALRLLGVRAPELLGTSVLESPVEVFDESGANIPPHERTGPVALATGRPQGPRTVGFRQPDGATRWVVVRAAPVRTGTSGAVVTLVDITERVLAEREARALGELWQTVATNLPDEVAVVDLDGRVLFTNRMSGPFPLERVIGAYAWEFVDEDLRADWQARLAEAVSTGRAVRFDTAGASGTVAGAPARYETALVPLSEDGTVRRVVVVARDVTEQKMLLARATEHERLASVGMIAASVAHEIMNPLTYVLASLEYAVSDRGAVPEHIAQALGDAREGAERMQQIVRDLRSLGRAGTEELLYVDPRSVLETALRLTGPEVAHAARLHVEMSDMPPVLASEGRLCQVFINLLVNAAQAVRHQPGSREIMVRSVDEDADGFVGVSVSDTGPGIPPGALARIFEPFYTTKPQGTGLGLSISRDIVARMGGRVEVQSAPGCGTTFTVWLPTRWEPRPSAVAGP